MRPTSILCSIFFMLTLIVGQGDAQTQNPRQVWAFYLSFWAGEATWEWNARVLQDKPTIGYYNSKLPSVAATHIQQAKSAGIDAFLVSWFGIDEQVTTTPALNNLLDRAAEHDFKIGVVVDMFPQEFNRDRERLIESLRWLVNDRAKHPAYVQVQGKPVITFAFQDDAGFDNTTWQAIRDAADPKRETLWIAEGLSACCLYDGAIDGMYAFNMAWANGNRDHYIAERNIVYARGANHANALYIPSISPGWDEDAIARLTGRRNPTSPRDRADGEFLTNAWNGALQAESDVIIIVTWNEFIENSHIEPSELYGTQSLDVLRPLIAAWKGTQPPSAAYDLSIPTCYAAYSYATYNQSPVNVYQRDQADSPVIGQMLPDTPYVVTGENNGLYAIDFEAQNAAQTGTQTGYVLANTIRMMPC